MRSAMIIMVDNNIEQRQLCEYSPSTRPTSHLRFGNGATGPAVQLADISLHHVVTIDHFGDDFMGQMTQTTASQH